MTDSQTTDRLALSEIEITPEMIEAGYAVLSESGAIDTPIPDLDRDVIQEIFRAMVRAKT